MAKYIGQLIEDEVRQQGINITDFAERICTTRENVYHLFKRVDINLAQLTLISKVLNRDFIREIYMNPEIINLDDPIIKKQLEEDKAMTQFYNVFPKAMENVGLHDVLVLTGSAFDKDDVQTFLPDIGLANHAIFFYKHQKEDLSDPLAYETVSDGGKNTFRICTNNLYGSKYVEIIIEYKTQLEWEEYLRFILDECRKRALDLRICGFRQYNR